jgi:hypothetical protein
MKWLSVALWNFDSNVIASVDDAAINDDCHDAGSSNGVTLRIF